MARRRLFFKKTMTPEELRRNHRGMAVAVGVGVAFLIQNLYRSIVQDVPQVGWTGYLTGPVFVHKVSEFLLLAVWIPYVWLLNHELAGVWPERLSVAGAIRLLRGLQILALLQVVLATYAWTLANLGTHPLTTGVTPLALGEGGWVWTYYLAALIVAGAAFVPLATGKALVLARRAGRTGEAPGRSGG